MLEKLRRANARKQIEGGVASDDWVGAQCASTVLPIFSSPDRSGFPHAPPTNHVGPDGIVRDVVTRTVCKCKGRMVEYIVPKLV